MGPVSILKRRRWGPLVHALLLSLFLPWCSKPLRLVMASTEVDHKNEDLVTSLAHTAASGAAISVVPSNAYHDGTNLLQRGDSVLLEDIPDCSIHQFSDPIFLRHLAAASGELLPADYSVLGVLVMTLGLIIVVEVVRHYLDHLARTRPFFQAVLRGVYTELSTLGMVELVIWLLHSYYDNLDVARESVFAKVHFCLFYTALLNAFQTVLLAVCSLRVARRLWVRTELLELNHYVELREEFDRVRQQLGLDEGKEATATTHKDSSTCSHEGDGDHPNRSDEDAGSHEFQREPQFPALSFAWSLVRTMCPLSKQPSHIRRSPHHTPLLHWKYRRLLLQVRFHELRVQFLQAYKLPLALKISNYLYRSQLHVLIGLVNVNMTAWLLLTLLANVLFVGIGLLLYETEQQSLVASVLTIIFLTSLLGFVLIALLMHRKMQGIFDCIMTHKELWEIEASKAHEAVVATNGSTEKAAMENAISEPNQKDSQPDQSPDDDEESGSAKQLNLFWFSDPTFVIALVQFMQFGYALALSIVIIFDDVIAEGPYGVQWYVLIIAASYAVFVLVVARMIPRYTLCTSLGQLVDEKRLHETVAEFHLEEAKIKRREEYEFCKFHDRFKEVNQLPETENLAPGTLNVGSRSALGLTTLAEPSPTMLSGVVVSSTTMVKHLANPCLDDNSSRTKRHDAQLMAELVRLDTASLRTNLPEGEQLELNKRDERRRRRKAFSEGVAAMAKMKSITDGLGVFERLGRSNSNRSLIATEHTASMLTRDDSAIGIGRSTPFANATHDNNYEDTPPDRKTRRGRRKSVSDGVAFMARLHDSVNAEHGIRFQGEMQFEDYRKSNHANDVTDRFDVHKPITSQALRSSVDSGASNSFMNYDAARNQIGTHVQNIRLPEPQSVSRTQSIVSSVTGSHAPFECNISEHDSINPVGKKTLSEDDDNASASSLGNQSDLDDIPHVDLAQKPHAHSSPTSNTWMQVLRAYYLSKRFVIVSNVFGTMAAFFFVGERIASFLYSQGITDPTEVISFHFNNTVNFWMLFNFLCFFVITSSIILFIFGPFGKLETNKERTIFISAILDFILSSVCLILFTVAELQRCCEEDGAIDPISAERGLPVQRFTSGRLLAVNEDEPSNFELPTCSCPTFGSRKFGGLGMIEPFVSLVGLRILRFWIAKRIVLSFESSFSSAPDMKQTKEHQAMNLDPLNFTERMDDKPMISEKGTIVELWETAVSRYPHLVAKHGEFSGEILQAMLGVLPIHSNPNRLAQDTLQQAPTHSALVATYEISSQYQDLSTRAQEIIISGALGKSMKASTSVDALYGMGAKPVIHEGVEATDGHAPLVFYESSSPLSASIRNEGRFLCPDACLVRSMRRCDRKLLPILDAWITVDVVMTRYEIVYFDAEGVDEPCANFEAEDVKAALVATRGGKGIRLCDISVGRRVVGQLALSDIVELYVERQLPHIVDGTLKESSQMILRNEYWSKYATPNEDLPFEGRHVAWSCVKQDVLVIHARDGGQLCLRFFSDLADAREHPDRWMQEDEKQGPLFKDNALQWALCLGRFCGIEQLKQDLPHFGDDTDEELKDYLVVRLDETRGMRHRRDSLLRMNSIRHRRHKSGGHSDIPAEKDVIHTIHGTSPTVKPMLTSSHRSVSMDEAVTSTHLSSLRRMLSRSSVGDGHEGMEGVLDDSFVDHRTGHT